MVVKTMAVAAAAVPTLLLVAAAVVIAVCMPFLATRRQRAARDAITALTRLAEVIQACGTSAAPSTPFVARD